MTLKKRIEAALASFVATVDDVRDVLRDCAAEIERLTGERDGWQEWHHRATRARDGLVAERDTLKARVAELEALILNGFRVASALTQETQTPEEMASDLVRQVREARLQRDEWKARVAELEERTRPIPGVTDGSREYEAYTLDDVALIEAQRGKAYSRLRVTVRTMLALATNHAMLLGGNAEDYVALPAKSGIAVLEFRDQRKVAETERDEWKARATEAAASAERMRALAPREAADTDAPVSRVGPETSDPPR